MRSWLAGLLVLCLSAGAQELPRVSVGILSDAQNDLAVSFLIPTMKKEIKALLRHEFQVTFPQAYTLHGQLEPKKIAAALDTLLAAEDVDLVVAIGPLGTLEACSRRNIPKPLFATYGLDSEMPFYPLKGNSSGVKNLNYLAAPTTVMRDLRTFQNLIGYQRVHIIVDTAFLQVAGGAVSSYMQNVVRGQGFNFAVVPVSGSPEEAIAALPEDVEAVYVTPMPRYDREAHKALFEGLKARKIPSFSGLGVPDVALGALAGLAPESDSVRLYRRLALNIQRVLLGEEAGKLPVFFEMNEHLTINMETARAIQWYPRWDVYISATLLNAEPVRPAAEVTLAQAVRAAVDHNPQLKADRLEIEIGKAVIRRARSAWFPQVESALTGVKIDEDSADASLGTQREHTVVAAVEGSQLIYSESARAALAIQREALKAREKAYETARLEMAQEAAQRFLRYLQAETLKTIRRNNLASTSAHLDTARTRHKIGIAGPSEVYRWESQIATDRREAIAAQANARAALAALNEVMNQPQDAAISAIAPSMINRHMRTGTGRLSRFVGDPWSYEVFGAFMIQEGLRNAPELSAIDAQIVAKQWEIKAAKRNFYVPTVALKAKLQHIIERSSNSGMAAPDIPFQLPETEETSWNVALNFSLPLTTGGRRDADLGRARIELEQLEFERESVRNKVELRVRIALRRAGSAYPAIQLSIEAAEAAEKNLELVDDAYSKGVATAVDLLDAQNAALVALESAENAIFAFFEELMGLQRAIADFDFFNSEAEQDAFYERLERFFEAQQK